jgi:hypothetical protein
VRCIDGKTSNAVAAALQSVIDAVGAQPELLHSDNGTEFEGHVSSLCERLGIQRSSTLPYSPHQNGKVETSQRDINQVLKHYDFVSMDLFKETFESHLEFSSNNRLHEALGYRSPDSVYGIHDELVDDPQALERFMDKVHADQVTYYDHIDARMNHNRNGSDKKKRVQLAVGSAVAVRRPKEERVSKGSRRFAYIAVVEQVLPRGVLVRWVTNGWLVAQARGTTSILTYAQVKKLHAAVKPDELADMLADETARRVAADEAATTARIAADGTAGVQPAEKRVHGWRREDSLLARSSR